MQEFSSSFFRADPIGRLIVCRLRINTRLRILLLAMGVGVFSFIILPWLTGFLLPRPGIASSLESWPGLIITFVTHPTVYLYFAVEQPDMIYRLFLSFSCMYSGSGEIEFRAFTTRLNQVWALKAWSILALALTAFGYVLHVQAVLSNSEPSYYNPHPLILLLVNAPLSALAGYMVVMMVIRHLIVIAAVFTLFRSCPPPIDALHPDKWGGLAFMDKFTLRAFCLIAILGLDMGMLVVMNVQSGQNPFGGPDMRLFLSSYLLLSPLLLSLPLAPAVKSMVTTKKSRAKDGA